MAKYNQPIHAIITRIYDAQKNKYHLLRNDTKIIFGKGSRMLGTVIMSNPGSFKFENNIAWEKFINGDGESDVFESIGTPDPTMINIIKAIETAYAQKGKSIPDGYIRIYNLSSVRCSKGDEALETHNIVKEILTRNGGDTSLLQDSVITDKARFENLCDESGFVIMGFLKKNLTLEAERLVEWIDKYDKSKKVVAHSKTNDFPYHPIVWIKLNGSKPFKDIVNTLQQVI